MTIRGVSLKYMMSPIWTGFPLKAQLKKEWLIIVITHNCLRDVCTHLLCFLLAPVNGERPQIQENIIYIQWVCILYDPRNVLCSNNNRSYWQFQTVPGIKSTASYETRIISLRTPLFFLAEALFGESYKILDLN